ncbi:unnamed protein product [Orchesella dallaii]|uniref:Uncharacterized protein n=1 Tax=Orchesella dallaii TaxID=48710 RepID=A0ABP1QCN8_9HEXA
MMRTLEQPRKPESGIDKFFFCAVVGCPRVGKSTYLTRLNTGLFVESYEKTFLPKFQIFDFTTNSNQVLRFHVYDFAGQKCKWAEKYIKMIEDVKESKCTLYLHDQTDQSTESGLTRFWRLLEGETGQRLPGVVLATKDDLEGKRDESRFYFHDVRQFPLLKISAKWGEDDDLKLFQPFLLLARQLLNNETIEFIQWPVPDRTMSIENCMMNIKKDLEKQLEAAMQEIFQEKDLFPAPSRLSFPTIAGKDPAKLRTKITPPQSIRNENMGRSLGSRQQSSEVGSLAPCPAPCVSIRCSDGDFMPKSITSVSRSILNDGNEKENADPSSNRLIRNPVASQSGKPTPWKAPPPVADKIFPSPTADSKHHPLPAGISKKRPNPNADKKVPACMSGRKVTPPISDTKIPRTAAVTKMHPLKMGPIPVRYSLRASAHVKPLENQPSIIPSSKEFATSCSKRNLMRLYKDKVELKQDAKTHETHKSCKKEKQPKAESANLMKSSRNAANFDPETIRKSRRIRALPPSTEGAASPTSRVKTFAKAKN